jgi:hypothetical protein
MAEMGSARDADDGKASASAPLSDKAEDYEWSPWIKAFWLMVNDPTSNHIICWTSNGRIVQIHDQSRMHEAMRHFPVSRKISSLRRCSRMYGFTTWTNAQTGCMEFKNELFTRDAHISQIAGITRFSFGAARAIHDRKSGREGTPRRKTTRKSKPKRSVGRRVSVVMVVK